jgi:ribosome-binding factor A
VSRPRRRPPSTPHRYPRSARLAELLREVLAEELERMDDERLELVTITQIDVDSEMNRAVVFFDSLRGAAGDAEIVEALGEHRVKLQAAIGRQVRAKKTPILDFRPDEVIREAERIERIIRDHPTPPRPDSGDPEGSTDSGEPRA